MKMQQALEVMNSIPAATCEKGYMVSFEHVDGGMLQSDHFPDKHAGETLIETEEEAWAMAKKFASTTVGKCVNVYVVGANFVPVRGYALRKIENRE